MNPTTAAALMVIFITLIIFVPLGVIYGMNNLFDLSIPYDFENWLSVVLIKLGMSSGVIHSAISKEK